jgi:hypothetical protein
MNPYDGSNFSNFVGGRFLARLSAIGPLGQASSLHCGVLASPRSGRGGLGIAFSIGSRIDRGGIRAEQLGRALHRLIEIGRIIRRLEPVHEPLATAQQIGELGIATKSGVAFVRDALLERCRWRIVIVD